MTIIITKILDRFVRTKKVVFVASEEFTIFPKKRGLEVPRKSKYKSLSSVTSFSRLMIQ